MTTEPQSHIQNHIVFLEMLQRGELLRSELLSKARPEQLKAILELCLNMKEGNLSMRTINSQHTIITTLANRNISLSKKKKWMLEYNEILYNIISPALKEFKRKVIKIYILVNMSVLQSFDMAYKRRRTTKKGKRSNENSPPFTVSLKSRKLKGTSVNSQIQKRLKSLLNKRGKFGKSQQEGGFIGAILAATAPLAVKGVKKILH